MAEARPAGEARPAAEARPSRRSALFAAGVVLALVAGFALGRVVDGGAGTVGAAAEHGHPPGEMTGGDGHDHTGGAAGAAGGDVSGLTIGDATFRLAPGSTAFVAGRTQPLRFRVLDATGAPVTKFTVRHDKPLHLIVARRDLSGFQHLHPTMAPDGTWSVPLTLPEPGVWRAYADFTATGVAGEQAAAVLGVDLTVAGDYRPRELPPPAKQASVAGFEIEYEGSPRVGATQPLFFRITRGGGPVDLERYLGAYGHLVVLRSGDLGYVHVHPEEQLTGGAVKFWLAAPSAGRYRMFFDFQVDGRVHTAEFTLVVD